MIDGAYGKMFVNAADTAMLQFMTGMKDELPWRTGGGDDDEDDEHNRNPGQRRNLGKKFARAERARRNRANVELVNRLVRSGRLRYVRPDEVRPAQNQNN